MQRCLQKLPAHRYQTAGELVAALDTFFEELGVAPRAGLLGALAGLGLEVKGAPPRSAPVALQRTGQSTTSVALVLAGFCALMAAGGFVIDLLAKRSGKADAEPGNAGRLELVPATPAFLRVVVQPWANVIVDGETFDTTPFARAIPLAPGTHYVRLEHPQAPTERRTIELVAGETILLDVTMKIRRPPGFSQGLGTPAPSSPLPADSSP